MLNSYSTGPHNINLYDPSCSSSVCTYNTNYNIPSGSNDWKFSGVFTPDEIQVSDRYTTVYRNYYLVGDSSGDVTGTNNHSSSHSFALPTLSLISGLPGY